VKTCLVLGAGASLANALHFRRERMRDTRPPLDTTFFETVQARGIALSAALRTYFRQTLGVEPLASTLREYRMEQVFADVFYDFGETPGNRPSLNAYIDLVDLYLRVLRETTNWLCEDGRTGAPIGRLLAAASKASDELTVITFNHDLVIENEISRRSGLRRRWCIDQCYGSMSRELNLLLPTSHSPVFQLHRDGQCDHDGSITLLKLHGSLNWVVRLQGKRPSANLLSGANNPKKLHLLARRQLMGRETFVRRGGGRGRQRWDLWPVVVPPVYAKQALRGAVQATWMDARRAIETADRMVVFGYSLPAIDIEAEKLFERALTKNASMSWIDVINPAPDSAARFASVAGAKSLRWYPGLDALLDVDGFAV
jgi:hypothetical protein